MSPPLEAHKMNKSTPRGAPERINPSPGGAKYLHPPVSAYRFFGLHELTTSNPVSCQSLYKPTNAISRYFAIRLVSVFFKFLQMYCSQGSHTSKVHFCVT